LKKIYFKNTLENKRKYSIFMTFVTAIYGFLLLKILKIIYDIGSNKDSFGIHIGFLIVVVPVIIGGPLLSGFCVAFNSSLIKLNYDISIKSVAVISLVVNFISILYYFFLIIFTGLMFFNLV
jgi:hypothetical protein